MTCDCIRQKNAYLAQWDTELKQTVGTEERVIVGVLSTKPGEVPVALVADFCPFCGIEYGSND